MKILIDTRALIWFLNGERRLSAEALASIGRAQKNETLFVSPMTAWEAALASAKSNPTKRPNLQGQDPLTWFERGCKKALAKVLPIDVRIALEAVRVPVLLGNGDPGDCFIVATAHIERLAIVTSDERMSNLAKANPAYLQVIAC